MQAKEYFNKPNTTVRILKIIGNVVFYVVILAIILFGIIGVVGRIRGTGNGFAVGGYNVYVVASKSMSAIHPQNFRKDDLKPLENERFEKGDLVVVRNLKSTEEINDLDVVTFFDKGAVIIHRVVDIHQDANGVIWYTTQGDANNASDGDRTRDEFKGIFVSNWGPKAGMFVRFIQSGYGIASIALALGVIIAAWLVYDAIKDKEKALEPEDLPEEEKSEA